MEFEAFQPQSTHMGLLADLINQDGQRQQDLAISTIKDKGTVARALKQLEAAGIIRREADLKDGRQKRIHLTEKGRRMCDYSRRRAECTMARAEKDIPAAELATCVSVLNRIYHNLHQQLLSPPPQTIDHEATT